MKLIGPNWSSQRRVTWCWTMVLKKKKKVPQRLLTKPLAPSNQMQYEIDNQQHYKYIPIPQISLRVEKKTNELKDNLKFHIRNILTLIK